MEFTCTADRDLPYQQSPAKYNGQLAAAHSKYYLNPQTVV